MATDGKRAADEILGAAELPQRPRGLPARKTSDRTPSTAPAAPVAAVAAKGEKRPTTADVMRLYAKSGHGRTVKSATDMLRPTPAIRTGIFAVDYMLMGGVPAGRITLLEGDGSSGKSLFSEIVLGAVHRDTDYIVGLADTEGTHDVKRSAWNGIDLTKDENGDFTRFVVIQAETAEQVIDVTDSLLGAADLGAMAVDAISTMLPGRMLDMAAGESVPGVRAQYNSLLCVRAAIRQTEARNETPPRYPTLILTTHLTAKFGVVGRAPSEDSAGGKRVRDSASLRLRFKMWETVGHDKATGYTGLLHTNHKLIHIKDKVGGSDIHEAEFKYLRNPHDPRGPGYILDNSEKVFSACKEHGLVTSAGSKGWSFPLFDLTGKEADIISFLEDHPPTSAWLQVELIRLKRVAHKLQPRGWEYGRAPVPDVEPNLDHLPRT